MSRLKDLTEIHQVIPYSHMYTELAMSAKVDVVFIALIWTILNFALWTPGHLHH